MLKVIYETPDSNKDWKSRYFFLEGDDWMCHPRDTKHMPVDTTWGILHPSCMHPSFFFTVRRRPQVDIEEFSFFEKIFSKT